MPIEIERRWVLQNFDFSVLDDVEPVEIQQGYLYKSLRVRITTRANDGSWPTSMAMLTRKTGKGLERYEDNQGISTAAAKLLFSQLKYQINKTRYVVDGWEIDVFRGRLEGLVLLERECATVEEARALRLPFWAGDAFEVTETLTNRQLAKIAFFLEEGKSFEPAKITPKRICVTGAPCSGKSTAIVRLKLERSDLHTVCETATIVLGSVGVTPAVVGQKVFQTTLRKAQCSFEDGALKQAAATGKRGLIYDRGTLDSAAFMGGIQKYEADLHTTRDDEYARYDAVIFLCLPRRSVYEANCANNSVRTETYDQSLAMQNELLKVWEAHPNFILVRDAESWDAKYLSLEKAIEGALKCEYCWQH